MMMFEVDRLTIVLLCAQLVPFVFADLRLKDQIIPSGYDKNEAPVQNGQPVDVHVTMHLINFRLFKEKDLSFTMDIFLHMTWKDYRLRINWLNEKDLTLSSAWMKEFWMPDVYFKNGISGNLHTGQFHTGYFILSKNSDYKGARVFLASRVSVEFLCDFDFKNYPHDQHICDLDLMSLSERNSSLKLNWSQFRVSKRIYNPDFHLVNPEPRDCTTTYPIGTYSCVRGRIELIRMVRRHFARKYTPTFLIVLTSFVGFWIPTSSYPARVSILVVSLLALITQQVQSQPVRSIQTISYNIWANVCIGLVFLALIEFAIAIIWDERKKAKQEDKNVDKNNNKNSEQKRKRSPANVENGAQETGTSGGQSKLKWLKMPNLISKNCNLIDAYSRVLFPVCFFFFVIGYCLFVKFRG